MLLAAISSRRLLVHPRCVETIRALQNFREGEQAAGYDITDLLPGIETPTLVIRHAGLARNPGAD